MATTGNRTNVDTELKRLRALIAQQQESLEALENAPAGVKVSHPVYDTGTSAAGAAQALDKALSSGEAVAAATSVFGTEMVAMKPKRKARTATSAPTAASC